MLYFRCVGTCFHGGVAQKFLGDFVCLFMVQDIHNSSQIISNVAHQCITWLQFFQFAFICPYFIFLQLQSQFKMVVGQSQGFFFLQCPGMCFSLDLIGFCLA